MADKLTTEQFISNSIKVHGDLYNYDKTEYNGSHKKVEIVCELHGPFLITPTSHVSAKIGCSKCGRIRSGIGKSNFHLLERNLLNDLKPPDGSAFIPLTKTKHAIVDLEDYDRVSKINWHYSQGYAYNTKFGLMHRFIMNETDPNIIVDHKFHDVLDNRKSNLRSCTKEQNNHNVRPRQNTSSPYKGVSWNKLCKKWRVKINYRKKTINIGQYPLEADAAKAYDRKAIELFGEFAYLNFPNNQQDN